MSDDDHPHIQTLSPDEPLPAPAALPAPKPKVKKRRLLLLLIPLAALAVVSTIFGMMMAVASDLPDLESAKEFQTAKNSLLFDTNGKPLGVLTSDRDRVLVSYDQISPFMRNAIIAIEDKRFYENNGVDLRGIGRAFYQDVAQGGDRPGRLDDRPAVRQERAPGAEQAHGLREAARGRARLPPDAQVVQGEDPHRVPELDLLRQRRLRDRVGRAHLLRPRPQPRGLRHAAQAAVRDAS